MSSFGRLFLVLVALLAGGCSSLSPQQRDRAQGVAVAARSAVVDCDQPNRCALESPLRALGGQAIAESAPSQPRHYATIIDEAATLK